MSLGAQPKDVLTLVFRRTAWLLAAGSIAGLVATVLGANVVSRLFYRVGPADPIALGGSILAVIVLSLAAAYVPARRAVRIDPVDVLRSE
jgi:ABC-type antimicrobial peptide transport system permease subunit